jgi:hypothetical protein
LPTFLTTVVIPYNSTTDLFLRPLQDSINLFPASVRHVTDLCPVCHLVIPLSVTLQTSVHSVTLQTLSSLSSCHSSVCLFTDSVQFVILSFLCLSLYRPLSILSLYRLYPDLHSILQRTGRFPSNLHPDHPTSIQTIQFSNDTR